MSCIDSQGRDVHDVAGTGEWTKPEAESESAAVPGISEGFGFRVRAG